MHAADVVDTALVLADRGMNATEIGRQLGVPRATVRDWLKRAVPHVPAGGGSAGCRTDHRFAELPPEYVYLLGLYLGDGSISPGPRQVCRLRLSLDARYPGIIGDCAAAIARVAPANRVGQISHGTWVVVYCYSKEWPCLFPQHGPGKKHERPIRLTAWQTELVHRWPDRLIRGLIHSDGCRFQNTGTNWSWPRYSFTNHSDDIRSILCSTCDVMGIRWTAAGPYTVYISRKADVAALDAFIGPKR
jgi:hypothetical protein